MATKYEVIELDHKEVIVDVSLGESLFFNATKMAKPFRKKVVEFLRIKPTQEYIEVLLRYNGKKYDDLVRIQKGRCGGTWLHHTLLFYFSEWLRPGYSFFVGGYLKEKLSDEKFYHIFCGEKIRKNVYVIECEGATKIGISGDPHRRFKQIESASGRKIINRFLSKPLRDAYLFEQRILCKFQEHKLIGEWVTSPFEEVAKYALTIISNEADMINKIIFGLSAKEFKRLHNVEDVRENLTAAELANLKRLQETNTGLIEAEMGYAERKEFLSKLHQKRIVKQIA